MGANGKSMSEESSHGRVSVLTLETLQDNLRRLAERLDFAMDDCDMGDALDFDSVASILCGLANGTPGDVIANGLELPTEYPEFEDE